MGVLERAGIVVGVLLLVGVPTALHGGPVTPRSISFTALLTAGGLALLWWRSRPGLSSALTLGLLMAALLVGGDFPDPAIAFYAAGFAVLALAWSGRAAWVVGVIGLAYLAAFYVLTGEVSWVATGMFTVPPYAAGTVLRLRRETADELAPRARELEDERELFGRIALGHERARIASELHDIVGHAISVMVIQAAAGQRLVHSDPVRAREAFAAISESARQGRRDLERLLELLGGGELGPAADLALVEEVVTRASRSGLDVTCRFEGDRERVPAPVAHLVFRLVQESLTNALRYAPGASVRVAVQADTGGRGYAVRVENDPTTEPGSPSLLGAGRGLGGLRERIQTLGGQFSAGPTGSGGWVVDARFPGG